MDNGTYLTVNQALNLLYLWETTDTLNELEPTHEELGRLRLQVIAEWNDITSPYARYLVPTDSAAAVARLIDTGTLFT